MIPITTPLKIPFEIENAHDVPVKHYANNSKEPPPPKKKEKPTSY